MGSCREMCRRVMRGLLVIPGCKTVCYRCILPPCYSHSESDDEKDEKDDEGYDSCGIAQSDTHLAADTEAPPRPQSSASSHDYVNQIEYTNIPQADQAGGSRSCENIYITMKLDSVDHLPVSKKEISNESRTTHVHKERLRVDADYVNTGTKMKCYSKPGSESKSNSSTLQLLQQKPTKNKNPSVTSAADWKLNKTPTLNSLSCPNLSETVHLVVSDRNKDSRGDTQTLVLLETDL